MAGGAIIVTQRERANQYTGHFTFFTFVAIITGATTGLVRLSRGPPTVSTHASYATCYMQKSLKGMMMDNCLTACVLDAALGLRQW